MAILFSQVTLSNEYYGTTEFFVSGYPQDADDLEGWCAFEDYTDEIEDSCAMAICNGRQQFCGKRIKLSCGLDVCHHVLIVSIKSCFKEITHLFKHSFLSAKFKFI